MPESQSTHLAQDGDIPVISGLSCRVSGARGQAAMWKALAEGRCTITSLREQNYDPAMFLDLRQTRRGKAYTLASGQLDGIYGFDAGFFGVSPREAQDMDPQQRLMLQAVWEAIEDAGLNPVDLAGDRTGVFVGSSLVENMSLYYADTARTNSGFSLGNTLCIIANRVSSFFDFGGPSYVLDAACASSLYALHQASEALCRGELDTAIVGGVHALLSPCGFVGFSLARMVSPSGVCRAFDAGADGYVRSEACVALVLQRPEVAQRMQARRRARLLASGVNTDGAASSLTVPSAARQEALLDRVLLQSGRDPEEFSFYEAHGTGTQIGDPAEARAIGRALAMLRREPLPIGSAKTNFGHAEPAAGLVGVAKLLLSLEKRSLPASLHFSNPNPEIDFEGLNLRVNTTLRSLGDDRPLLAGVNSFGFGGTNVAAIIESASPVTPRVHGGAALPASDHAKWLLLSAASPVSLAALASGWADRLDRAGVEEQVALCAAAATRAGLTHRLAVPLNTSTPATLRQQAALGCEEPVAGAILGKAGFQRSRTVFAFPGNGAQIPGMGIELYDRNPAFRTSFDRVAAAMAEEAAQDLVGLMHAPDLGDRLGCPEIAQPLLFAYQVSLTDCLAADGIRPEAVIGHSVGEIAALHVAGCFDLPTAARIIMTRSRAFETLRGRGGMAVIAANEADVVRAISGLDEPDLAIAAVNSPRSVTVSGPDDAISRLGRVTLRGKRMAMVRLKVELPYHSPLIEALRQRFKDDLDGLSYAGQTIPVAGSALGRVLRPGECDAEYLWRNARDCVRFFDAFKALAGDGACQVVEISPAPVLRRDVNEMARFGGIAHNHFLPAEVIADKGTDSDLADVDGLLTAHAWAQGLTVDLERLTGPRGGALPDMPSYPWDEREYRSRLTPDGLDAWSELGPRYLTGKRADQDSPVWVRDLTPTGPVWLADHKLNQEIVLAGAVLVEMALAAGSELWPDHPVELQHFDILAPTVIEGDGVRIRTEVDLATGNITISRRPRLTRTDWLIVARGVLRRGDASVSAPARPLREGLLPADDVYDVLSARGLSYGPAFRRMAAVSARNRSTIRVALSEPLIGEKFVLDPTALDAAFHGLAAMALSGKARADEALTRLIREDAVLLPTRIEHLLLLKHGACITHAGLKLLRTRQRSLVVQVDLYDRDGVLAARIAEADFTVVWPDAARRMTPDRIATRLIRLREDGQKVVLPVGWRMPARIVGRLAPLAEAPDNPISRAIRAFRGQGGLAGPETDVALRAVLDMAPDLADNLRALMLRAANEAGQDVARFGSVQRRIWARFGLIAAELQRKWPETERFSLLLSGMPDMDLLRRLASSGRIDRIGVTAFTAEERSLLAQLLPPDLAAFYVEAPEPGGFDVVLAAGQNAAAVQAEEALAPGGLLIGIAAPDFSPGAASPMGSATGYLDDAGVALEVNVRRKPMTTGPCQPASVRPALAAPLPDKVSAAIDWAGHPDSSPDQATHRVLFCDWQPGLDLAQQIAALLVQLRSIIPQSSLPLVLIAVNGEPGSAGFKPFAAALRSACVSAANEYGDHSVRFIALHDGVGGNTASELARLLRWSDQESVLHLREGRLLAERLTRLPTRPVIAPVLQLRQRIAGRLDTLEWGPARKPRLGPEDVEVEVLATGLNFRDVMSARGLLSERILEAGASGAGMGMEYAGIVRRGGAKTRLRPGTPVMGFARAAFASRLVLPEAALFGIPDGISAETAASIPVAFVTAWEALINLARIMPGETVLIHGGAGGVGLAAIQIARTIGAQVLATAGTVEKRALARAYGADAAFNSRDLSFAGEVMRATGGKGVDVVLNSLSGEAMQRSVGCLAPFGRFVELGKRDYLEGTPMDLRPFSRNLSYYGLDLDQRLAASPSRISEIMEGIRAGFADGHLRPIPVTRFSAGMAEEAFRHMLSARHTGKIVMTPARGARRGRTRPIRDDWVIIGGTGGLGLAVAQWLLNSGAAHVHLLSRSGEVKPGSGQPGRWAEAEARLSIHAVDATDHAALTGFFEGLSGQGRRVGGIIHAAMILRDRLLKDVDGPEARQVIDAKLTVAARLAGLLRDGRVAPDHVIFFSSIASHLGNPGQAAYSAANAAVDALADQLRQEGFPVSAFGWGPVDDAGHLTRNAVVAAQLSKMEGIGFLRSGQVIAELEKTIREHPPQNYSFAPVDWVQLAPALPAFRQNLYARLVPAAAFDMRSLAALTEDIRALDWPAAIALTEAEMCRILSGIMRMPVEQFEPQRPLSRYGIDSLMALELRLELERRFGTAVTSFSFTEDMTAASLAAQMVERVKSDQSGEGDDPPSPSSS
ncbi:type I polyketide synthase [Paracoccus sp. SCSIO 75233]|uniref:type I polyketide synthase n=1 Tax=Paracoccus sp. SCSIO 75233 TaxID=3017782 RepID=UPI0022F0FA7D|nr:type I polyketide synthase [Paracoccus sp. SCSIO 75233]WBU55202.1 SDR family NAD(P)-dependent oxidoreductase [Paracoccus sp. SCSIO 75233]